ncbi:MAG: Heat shock protein 70 [Flaviaesturariibacter sp.]|nr:Heat shock protein 70 [Flaviaesturariibacter sp.]
MQFVNFGIDLGTTNSLIARFNGGSVEVFKNPLGHKETLPSVVAFRGERTLVGDKAKEYITKDPGNVFSAFKRKMGTTESFLVPSTTQFVSPVSLSATVLKELKHFVHTGEEVSSVVITIPASFDTVQSNATKKAGYEAGFKEVLLLQEPIAASLAYFNESKRELPEKGSWLVYDLGGGTFDVALVTIVNGELKVVDHEGNNFLGGVDFDTAIIDSIVIPAIAERMGDPSIEEQLRNRNGALEKLFYVLLYKTEEAKKDLSISDSTEIEFELPDGRELVLTITRDQLNDIIRDRIIGTTDLIHTILRRNSLLPASIEQVIMVGGSTYIPYVRQLVAERTGIPLAFDADPTTAIVEGAAYYAGSRLRTATEPVEEGRASTVAALPGRSLRSVFQTVSSEEEELYMAIPEGDFTGLSFRITRDDGGFDSGLKAATARISEFLPLLRGTLNRFHIRFFDATGTIVPVDTGSIDIMQGKFNVAGQPLPNDICLEVDDLENNSTRLQPIFERNDILPLKRTVYKEMTRTIAKGSKDVLVINVLEGSRHSRPHSNLVIGMIEIKGADLAADLVKGSDVEIRFEMSESRDLTIAAFLAMTEQEFKNVFNTSEKYVSVSRLRDDINSLVREMRRELEEEKGRDEENEWFQELYQCVHEAEKLQARLAKMKESDVTDARYEISEQRRRLSARYDALGQDQRIITLQADYFNAKEFIDENLPFVDVDREKVAQEYDRIIRDEAQYLKVKSPAILRAKIDALEGLKGRIYANTRHYITNIFLHVNGIEASAYPKPSLAKTLQKQGEKAMAEERFDELRTVTIALYNMLYDGGPEAEKTRIKGTGIG